MPGDNIPESMGEDISEQAGAIISESVGGFPRNQQPAQSGESRSTLGALNTRSARLGFTCMRTFYTASRGGFRQLIGPIF
jgi:hypothetical protein